MTEYEHEHGGIWGTESATWECSECGTALHSPSDFEIVDGADVCRSCLD